MSVFRFRSFTQSIDQELANSYRPTMPHRLRFKKDILQRIWQCPIRSPSASAWQFQRIHGLPTVTRETRQMFGNASRCRSNEQSLGKPARYRNPVNLFCVSIAGNRFVRPLEYECTVDLYLALKWALLTFWSFRC